MNNKRRGRATGARQRDNRRISVRSVQRQPVDIESWLAFCSPWRRPNRTQRLSTSRTDRSLDHRRRRHERHHSSALAAVAERR
jgi:hypothetical protein